MLEELRGRARGGVHVIGGQPDEVLVDLYRRCRALIFPGEEDFGIVPLEAMAEHVSEQSFDIIREHIIMSLCVSIDKAKRLLGYAPRYTTEQIFVEAIDYLLESGQLDLQ